MQIFTIIQLIQAPILLLLLVLYLKFKFNIANWKQILLAITFGIAAIIPLLIVDKFAQFAGYDILRSLKRGAFYSFVVIGAGAEIGKFVFLRYYFLKLSSVKGSMDTIIYAMLISLGFTTFVLPLYVYGIFSQVPSDLFLYTYPLFNIMFAIIVGFFVGLGKMRKNRMIDSFTGLGAASFFHGFYFFSNLASDKTILMFFGAGVIFIAALLGVKSINMKQSGEEELDNNVTS